MAAAARSGYDSTLRRNCNENDQGDERGAMNWLSPFLIMFLASLGTVLAMTPVARRIAIRLDAVDYPNATAARFWGGP